MVGWGCTDAPRLQSSQLAQLLQRSEIRRAPPDRAGDHRRVGMGMGHVPAIFFMAEPVWRPGLGWTAA